MREIRASGYALITLATLFMAAQLCWQWLHGGIAAHHLLANPALPAVSDAWGLVILPALAWLAARRLPAGSVQSPFGYALAAAFGYGLLLALLFLNDIRAPLPWLFFGTYLLALLLPLHRAEVILGYVAALSLAVGPVLPLLMSSPAILIAWLSVLTQNWLRQRACSENK
jgi:hypothetical protein